MKQSKKIISLIIAVAMLISAVSVLGLIPASAAPGDRFVFDNPDNAWKGQKVSKIEVVDGYGQVSYAAGAANQDQTVSERSFLLADKSFRTGDVVQLAHCDLLESTHYRLNFDLYTEDDLSDFYIEMHAGPSNGNFEKNFSVVFKGNEVSSRATVLSNESGTKAYNMSFDFVTPDRWETRGDSTKKWWQYEHLQVSLCAKRGATLGAYKLHKITVTELYSYTVKDSDGATLGTVYGLAGDDTAKLFDASGINSDNLAYTSITPATIADNTTEITVTYDTVKTLDVYNQDSQKIGTVSAQNGDDVYTLIENSEYNYEHSRFTVSPATVAADTTSVTVTYVYSHEHNVYDDANNLLGSIWAFTDDSSYEVLADTEFDKEGFEFAVEPEIIDSDDCDLIITYTEIAVQDIDFGVDYCGNPNATGYNYWAYFYNNQYATLELVHDEDNDNYKIHTINWPTGGVKINANTEWMYRSVLLANKFASSGLLAGKTYRVQYEISLDDDFWKPENLTTEFRFGATVGNGLVATTVPGAFIQIPGNEIENYIVKTDTLENTKVYTVSVDVTLPTSGWDTSTEAWTHAKRNISMSIYGCDYTLDNVKIYNMYDIPVEDSNGKSLGTVLGRIGDNQSKAVAKYLTNADYDISVADTSAVIENLDTPIIATKTLKYCYAQVGDFASYPTGSSRWMYISGHEGVGATGILKVDNGEVHPVPNDVGGGFKWNGDLNNRAVLISNTTGASGLVGGEDYVLRLIVKIDTQFFSLSNLEAQVAFENYIWATPQKNMTGIMAFDDISEYVKSSYSSGTNVYYTIDLPFTLPSDKTDKNVLVSIYDSEDPKGTTDFYITKAYVLRKTSAKLTLADGSHKATGLTGYLGYEIGDTISDDGLVKYVGVTNTFGYNEINSYKILNAIRRGDCDGNFIINASDLIYMRQYLLGVESDDYDIFGLNANATSKDDTTINLLDLVSLKKKLASMSESDIPSNLHFGDYELAWNYEFSDANVNGDYLDAQQTSNPLSDVTYVRTSDSRVMGVENGILSYGPAYEGGNIIVPDEITTKTTMNFAYGYFEIRAKLPFNSANVPAFWFKSDGTLSKSGTGLQEIDLMETFGSADTVSTCLHYWNGNTHYNTNALTGRSLSFDTSNLDTTQFHNYGMEWYKENGVSYIAFYIDGIHIKTMNASSLNGNTPDFSNPVYFLLSNSAASQSYYDEVKDWATDTTVAGADDFPMNIEVDYIRLYQSTSNNGNILVTK